MHLGHGHIEFLRSRFAGNQAATKPDLQANQSQTGQGRPRRKQGQVCRTLNKNFATKHIFLFP